MAYLFDFENQIINITSPQTDVDIQELINEIRTQEATEQGIAYGKIADASGKEDLGGSVVELLGWQLKFWEGSYIAKISGGNLVGGISGDPVAYSAGVQTLLIQSAASTVVQVSSGSGLSIEEHNQLMALDTDAIPTAVWSEEDRGEKLDFVHDIEGGKWTIAGDQMIFFKSDNLTEIARFDLYDSDGNPTMSNVMRRDRT
jgi:hypothetical protein